MTLSRTKAINLFLALLAGVAKADLVVYCEHNENTALKRSGGFKEYSECIGDVCTCYAYELLCLVPIDEDAIERTVDNVKLESVSYEFA